MSMSTFTTESFLWVDPSGRTIPLRGLCGHCQIMVDSFDPNHRVTSIVNGGRGVECVLRGDISSWEGGPLRYVHDADCESEFVIEGGAWTPCACEPRALIRWLIQSWMAWWPLCVHCGQVIVWDDYSYVHYETGFADCGVSIENSMVEDKDRLGDRIAQERSAILINPTITKDPTMKTYARPG